MESKKRPSLDLFRKNKTSTDGFKIAVRTGLKPRINNYVNKLKLKSLKVKKLTFLKV